MCIPNEVSFDSLASEVTNVDNVEEVVKKSVENSSTGDTESDDKKVIGTIDYKYRDLPVGSTEIYFTGTIAAPTGGDAAEGATAGSAEIAAEQEPERYGTAHYSENVGFLDGIRYFFRSILHSGANGTLYLDVPALLFLIIIVSAILIVVILIFSYMAYIARRRRRSRRRRRRKK